MISRGLGFIESGVNPNDAIYAAPKIELPKSYELKEQLRVYDQGNKGSTSFRSALCFSSKIKKESPCRKLQQPSEHLP